MVTLIESIVYPESDAVDPKFPHAPLGWTSAAAQKAAAAEGIAMSEKHWDAVRALQEYYARHAASGVNPRELHDALDERFHAAGGLRELYVLFPKGPIAQGCRIAGLPVPPGAIDKGFGSVV
jgi:tRNA 2-thiouridine synthesizing protein E